MTDGCQEFSKLSRRGLLRGAMGGLVLGAGGSVVGSTFVNTSYAATRSAEQTLVVVSLRGASDGLSLVVPHGDPIYYQARPGIAIAADQLLVRDDFFGLHPALAPLLPLWNAGRFATVHATGQPVANRSHFAAMESLEEADPGSSTRVGWINRLIGRDDYTNPLQAICLGQSTPPTALYGPESTVTAYTVDDVVLAGVDQWDNGRREASMNTIWGSAAGKIGAAGRGSLAAVADFAPARAASDTPANGAVYGDDSLGRALQSAARTIKADVGAEVITLDHDGGWDMHTDLGTLAGGGMVDAAGALATSLAAFFTDLGSWSNKVTVVALSEFGRRVKENGNYGVDHGYGNAMFLLGAGVKGGYYGTWPGLQDDWDADLGVTTDYRSVLAEVVTKRLGASSAAVFPGFTPEPIGAML